MRWRWGILFVFGWLSLTAAAYAFILTRDERGTGMKGMLLVVLAFIGGSASTLGALLAFINSGFGKDPARFRHFLMWTAAAVSFAGIIPVIRHGAALYRQEQEEAKHFVEQRIADAQERVEAGASWPTSQDDFIAGHSPPRLLQDLRFYRFDPARGEFEIYIHVDFDGGWVYHSRRGTWHRST